jgi:hypothetical protein
MRSADFFLPERPVVSMLRMGRLQGVYKPKGVLEVRASALLHEGA